MSKNNNPNNKGNKNNAPKGAPKAPAAAPKTAAKKQEEVIENAQLNEEQVRTLAGTNPDKLRQKMSTLSADMKILAFSLLEKTVVNPADPALAFPLEVRKKTNMLVALGTVTTLMDHCANGDDTFALLMQKTDYAALIDCAKAAGYDIELPDIKALPATEDGNVTVKAKDVKIGAETKKQLKKEDEIRKGEKPELDPTKIVSEEDLTKALEYMFLTHSKRLPELMMQGIDFMKQFRLAEAERADNTEEAKARFETYNSGDWLDDLFTYVKPTIFFGGIGRGMASVVAVEKNPIHAFVILRDAIKDKQSGQPVLDDTEIAYCVKSIVKWCCNVNIESNKKSIENMDAKKNKTEIEKCEAQIQNYTNILDYITSPSFDEIDTLLENIGVDFTKDGGQLTQECQDANKTFNVICRSYYGKELSTNDYKNLGENIKQYGYHIINLFRSAGEQLTDCGLSYVSELEERSEEEKKALAEETKKAWAERKAKAKEEETKNA